MYYGHFPIGPSWTTSEFARPSILTGCCFRDHRRRRSFGRNFTSTNIPVPNPRRLGYFIRHPPDPRSHPNRRQSTTRSAVCRSIVGLECGLVSRSTEPRMDPLAGRHSKDPPRPAGNDTHRATDSDKVHIRHETNSDYSDRSSLPNRLQWRNGWHPCCGEQSADRSYDRCRHNRRTAATTTTREVHLRRRRRAGIRTLPTPLVMPRRERRPRQTLMAQRNLRSSTPPN